MPVIIVYGLPEGYEEGKITALYESLSNAVVEVKELGLRNEEQITFFFPPDKMKMGLGDEIIVFVEGLFEKPERTDAIRNCLAEVIVKRTRLIFPDIRLIKCFVKTFNPRKGFFSSERPKI